jgi:hypothetical protein
MGETGGAGTDYPPEHMRSLFAISIKSGRVELVLFDFEL